MCGRLEEAEERYQNRESRDEDLALIQKLNDDLLQKEDMMKRLVVCCLFEAFMSSFLHNSRVHLKITVIHSYLTEHKWISYMIVYKLRNLG